MRFESRHPLQPYWDLVGAPLQVQALEQALTLGLFDLLQAPAAPAQVAERLRLDRSASATWLELLWSMGLLTRHAPPQPSAAPEYGVSAVAARFFREASSENCTQAWLYRARLLGRFASQMETLLRDGHDPGADMAHTSAPAGSWAQAARMQIGQEQRHISVPAVLERLACLHALPDTGRLLDLGGGPGHVAIALAQRLAGWRGTVCDGPETAAVAQENIQRAGLDTRLDTLGCDLNQDGFGSGYDLVWCSSVLHFMKDPHALLRRICESLAPGGVALLAHAEVPDDPAVAAAVMPFYASLKFRGNYLPAAGEVPAAMTLAGFEGVQALGRLAFPLAPVWLYLGRRPA